MKISIPFGAAVLSLAALTTTCMTVGSQPAGGGVYLVGVAGGG
jgi:hypothetical protein